MADEYAPRYTPFPPRGQVKPCFVKMNPNRYLTHYLVDRLGDWAGGMLTAWCDDEGNTLTLTNLAGDKRIHGINRFDVLRPYWK